MKFNVTIKGWGEDALEFLNPEMNFLVIFNDNAPEELAEISILHTKSEVFEDPAPGDIMFICGKAFDITAVGEEAKHTLRTLGHCTLNFNGGSAADRPGCIMLEGSDPITAEDIKVGGTIQIF